MSRVLLVSPTSVPGGAERALAALAARFPELGVEPCAALLEDGPLQGWLEQAGCPVDVIPAGRTRQLVRTARVLAELRALAVRRQADVIISNQSKGHVYGGLAGLAARIPAVWWQQGVPGPGRIENVARLVPSAAVICSSDAAVAAQSKLTPHRRIEKVHLGVPVDEIGARVGAGASIRRELGWENTRIVGIVGRLQPWKGQDVFLRAAAAIAVAEPDVRFAVVGGAVLGWEGSYPDDLQRLATELGIADKVLFAGHQADPFPWFDALDVVVHASVGEPFGLVLLEALALGKPLVASADGGPLEIVEHERSGLLVPPGEPKRTAEAVLRILREPQLAQLLAAEGPRRAREFSDARMAVKITELADSIHGSKTHGSRWRRNGG